jgi:Tol biopolymer transport system component
MCLPVSTLGAAIGAALSFASASAQETVRVSVDSNGIEGNKVSGFYDSPRVSADGQVVAFSSWATNLVPGDTNFEWDVFVHERASGVTERVSVDSSGIEADLWSDEPSISGDGRFVAFESAATNLVPGDSNWNSDIFVRDRLAGTTERVSIDSSGSESVGGSSEPSISADGNFIAFVSNATNLVTGDTNGTWDIFVHDRSTGLTERVSVDSSGAEANDRSEAPSISADGQVVAFDSFASNLVAGDTNQFQDVFVHDRGSGVTERVSVDSTGGEGNDQSGLEVPPAVSSDGQVVAFESFATNLVAVDANGVGDVFVHERGSGLTELVSVRTSGSQGNDRSAYPSLSADGRFVAFSSNASNLVAHDTNNSADVLFRDRVKATTIRVSVDSSKAQAAGNSFYASLSADGEVVAFVSDAANLVTGDTNQCQDVFVHELCSSPASWSNYGAGFPGTNGVPAFTSQQNPVLGTTITLDLANSYGNPTTGLIFVGFSRADIHSGWGGDLLVAPALILFVTFSYGGDSFTGDIPDDPTLCGFAIDLQAIESDPGATKGVSFTPGLELLLGI